MIISTYSGSRYEIDFEDKTFHRLEYAQGKFQSFDDNILEYAWINISPFKAPEQIIGWSIMVVLKDGTHVQTSYVTEIES